MICENCSTRHEGKYGSGRFCTSKCARGFSRKLPREEMARRMRVLAVTTEARSKAAATLTKRRAEEKNQRLSGPFKGLQSRERKQRVLEEQNFKCLICGLSEWLGNPITLHFDHVDGEHSNNARSNVRCICPNCHSQTPTYAGKNKRLKRKQREQEESDCAEAKSDCSE